MSRSEGCRGVGERTLAQGQCTLDVFALFERNSSGESIEFEQLDEQGELQVLRSPVSVRELEDGATMIIAPVPRPHAEIEAATRFSTDGLVRSIEL